MDRSPDNLARAALAAGAVLLSHELVQRRDGSWTLSGRFGFEDPWAAARLLCILAEEDAADPAVQDWSREILDETAAAYGTTPDNPTIIDAFVEAVHANVQRFIRFAPEEGERFQSADTTMIEGVGDCDCHARLAHALVRSRGASSELRFFDQDGEPTHAVAAFGTSAGPQWAETTIAAAFGEHPQAAYKRLGLDRANARPDIGAGPRMTTWSRCNPPPRYLGRSTLARGRGRPAAPLGAARRLDGARRAAPHVREPADSFGR